MNYRYTPEEIGEMNATIDRQKAEIERLRAALKPFADFDASHDNGDLAVTIQLNVRPHDKMELPLSAFHAARAAITK